MPTLAALHVYPVKGLRGGSPASAHLEPWGLAADRRFLVVDANGRFLTQREIPAMACLEAGWDGADLLLQESGRPPLRCRPRPDAEPVAVTIWRDRVTAHHVDAAADAWLSTALRASCRLVYMSKPADARPVDPAFARPEDRVSFADGFPVLLTSAASLDDLNGRLPMPVGMERFRPNLVVTGAAAWAEDHWHTLRIGDAVLDLVKPCARCIVTTTDQATGQRAADLEPIRTLKTFRGDGTGQVLFGGNLVPRRCGRLAVGDDVTILA